MTEELDYKKDRLWELLDKRLDLRKEKKKSVFDGLITVYMKGQTIKVL